MNRSAPSPEGHTLDEEGGHDPDCCYSCLAGREVKSGCRCGACCRGLILEALPQDAEREPLIKEKGSPLKGFRDALGGICSTAQAGRASS